MQGKQTLDLHALAQQLERRGLHTPVVVHVLDIIGHRLERLQSCFREAVERYQYSGSYQVERSNLNFK